jgi:hypothetical protein
MLVKLVYNAIPFVYPLAANWFARERLGTGYGRLALASGIVITLFISIAGGPFNVSLGRSIMFAALCASILLGLVHISLALVSNYAHSKRVRIIWLALVFPLFPLSWLYVNLMLGCALLKSCV